MDSIRIFVTGGTFDKEYNELTGELYFTDTHVQKMLQLGRPRIPIEIRTLMMVDSLDMKDADRATIASQCRDAHERCIVVTHGTDTMTETAKVIAETVQDKIVVLTGAMVPYTFGSSDGLFNLGGAIAFVQCLPPGVYVVMNGVAYSLDNVRKNKKTGMFEEVHAA